MENLEDFGIDVRVFARLVQKAVACSCSVSQSEQKNKGQSVTIQGNQVAFVGKVLLGRFCPLCKMLAWLCVCVCVSWPLWEKNLGLNLVGFVFLVKCFHGYVCVCLLASV